MSAVMPQERRRLMGRGRRGAVMGRRMTKMRPMVARRQQESQIQNQARPILTAEVNSPVGDFIRVLFHVGGVDFIDRQVSADEFDNQYKCLSATCLAAASSNSEAAPTVPSHVTPSRVLLEVGDEFFDSVVAISQYVAARGSLIPDDPTRRLKLHMIYSIFEDAVQEAMGVRAGDKGDMRIAYTNKIMKALQSTEKLMTRATHSGGNAGAGTGASESDRLMSEKMITANLVASGRYPLTYLDIAIGIYMKQLFVPMGVAALQDLSSEMQINQANYPILFALMTRVCDHPKVKKFLPWISPQPKVKLTYFDTTGRAEPVRWALTLAGIDFEDCRISMDEWLDLKKHSPNGQVPMLEIENEGVFAETLAMMNWAASQANLIPTTEEANLHALAIYQSIENAIQPIAQARKAAFQQAIASGQGPTIDPQKFAEVMRPICENILPGLLSLTDSLVSRYQDAEGHVICGRLTYIDLIVASTYLNLINEKRIAWVRDFRSQCPSMQRCFKMVTQIQLIRELRMWPAKKPTLYYFDVTGRAESIRLAFAAAGIEFEDKRFTYDEWVSIYRDASPTKKCPFLEVGDSSFGGSGGSSAKNAGGGLDVITSTRAILQWISDRAGFNPDTARGRVHAEKIYSFMMDKITLHQKKLYPIRDAEEKKRMTEELRTGDVAKVMKCINDMVGEMQDSVEGFIIEGELSWIDMFVTGEVEYCLDINLLDEKTWKNQYQNIAKIYNLIHTKIPAIQEYLSKRNTISQPKN